MATNTHAISLNGTTQYLSRANGGDYDLTTGTVEAWVNITDLPSGNAALASTFEFTTTKGFNFNLVEDTATTCHIQFYFGASGSGIVTTSASTITYGVSTHIAVAWDTSTGIAYINGVASGGPTALGTLVASANQLEIGREVVTTRYFSGKIDEVRIWNTKRSAAQLLANMNTELVGNESGLLSYWKLNNALTDSTSGGRTLTNNNSATFTTPGLFIQQFTATVTDSIGVADTISATRQALATIADTVGVADVIRKQKFGYDPKPSATWANVNKTY